MGYIELWIGPMFSGKTTKVVELYNEIKADGKQIIAINYDKDTRYYTNKITTHDDISIPCISISTLDDIYRNKITNILDTPYNDNFIDSKLAAAEYVFINEAQFFDNLKQFTLELAEKYNKNIILCGLDSDFKREKFGEILDLIPHANKITKLYGLCAQCSEPSIYTHRLSKETKQEVIGVKNYIPLCRGCYLSCNK